MSEQTWASGALGNDPARALASFQKGITVDLIATGRAAFETCASHEELSSIVERNRVNAFDYLPVTESALEGADRQARIIGLIEILPYMHGSEAHGLVRETMRPLSEENLIGADASVIAFVRDADRQRCRLVVSGTEITGLVSLSDLQRLPVRAALFAMITQLEMIMANSIRTEFGRSEGWIQRMSDGRQSGLQDKIAAAKSDDGFVDALLLTEFADKVTIIKKSPKFGWGKNAFVGNLEQVQALRDYLAHANDYAATRVAAIRTCETVRLIDTWIERLSAWPPMAS